MSSMNMKLGLAKLNTSATNRLSFKLEVIFVVGSHVAGSVVYECVGF